jgi:hypothetical protein
VKKQLEKIIRQVRPDIVHTHNLFSAKMMSEFDMPFAKQIALHNYSPMRSCLALTQEKMDTIEKNIQTLTEKAFLNYLTTMI